METVSEMTTEELMGSYRPENLDVELCPVCASRIRKIKFDDGAHGNPRNFIEKNCTEADCVWWSIE